MKAREFWRLDQISDERLVGGLKELLTGEGRTEARIVAHLAELDARRLHLKGARSLFAYCQEVLGLSDNQAYYRIAAARVARRFPIVFELLEYRAIHLTSIAPLGKCLTEENHLELLREAGRLSRRDLLKLLARRAPRPDVPSKLRKLVPEAGAVSMGPTGSLEPLSETSYRLQLNTSEALKQKLALARDLMSHANPSGDLAVVVERGLDLLIEKLQARRFGQTTRPHPRGAKQKNARAAAPPHQEAGGESDIERSKRGASEPPERSRTRGHIANEIRRRLIERDGCCCSFVAADGRRCAARAFLQIDHKTPWAKGGAERVDNLRLLCQAHNQLLAEREFGVQHISAAIERRRR